MFQLLGWAHGHAGAGGALIIVAVVLLVAAMLGSMSRAQN